MKSQLVPSKIISHGRTYTKQTHIANQFNEYFINVCPNLASNIHQNQVSDNVLPTNLTHTIFLSPVNPNQVSSALSRLDGKKATIDILNHLLKLTSLSLSIPLTKMYNESIELQVQSYAK